MAFVMSKALELKVDRLEILGDLADTHSILNLKVLNFWQKWFHKLNKNEIETYVLRGNHDVGGDYNDDYSWLNVFGHLERIKVVLDPMTCPYGVGYMPYIHDNKKFVEEANKLADYDAKILVSHTTYQGSKYDNGMFAPDGVDQDLISPKLIHLITGHVHAEQEFGRVWYPGTARWLSKSCANRRKGIWLVEHDDETLAIKSKEFISTESVCHKIVSIQWHEGEAKPEIPANAKVDIELIGSSDWISKTKKDLVGVSVSSKMTDTKKSRERKSGKSLFEFLSKHYETDKREKLIGYMKGLDLV